MGRKFSSPLQASEFNPTFGGGEDTSFKGGYLQVCAQITEMAENLLFHPFPWQTKMQGKSDHFISRLRLAVTVGNNHYMLVAVALSEPGCCDLVGL